MVNSCNGEDDFLGTKIATPILAINTAYTVFLDWALFHEEREKRELLKE
jgi:hypothetical protein